MNNIAQSNPEGELERLGRVRNFRRPEEEGSRRKGLDGAVGASEGDDGVKKAQKKHKKWPIVVLVLVILAVAGGGVAWWMTEQERAESEGMEDMKEVEVGELEDELVELDLDDELVQRLYAQVSGNMNYGTRGGYLDWWSQLVQSGTVSDEYVKYVALQNTGMERCEVTGREMEIGNFTLVQMAEENTCVSGNAVQQKAKEIFGREVTFTQDEEVSWKNYVMYYDAEKDEFWGNATDGGGYPMAFDHILYRAEQDAERIYLYELMGSRCVVYIYHGDESISCSDEFPGMTGGDALAAELRWYGINGKESWIGENIPEMTSTEFKGLSNYFEDSETWDEGWKKFREQNRQNMLQHADLLSQYRWVFVKNEKNSYIFEKIEKVK